MRSRILVPVVLSLAIVAKAADSGDQEPSLLRQAFGPGSFASSGVAATIEQARGAPHEWGGGMKGFGRRFGSSFGTHLVKVAIQYPIAKVRHEHIGYVRSREAGFGPRMKHAVISTFVTTRTDREGRTIAAGNIAGLVGAGFISRTWQPERLHTVGSGMSTAGILIGVDIGYHVLREFWPNIRHPRGGGQQMKPTDTTTTPASRSNP